MKKQCKGVIHMGKYKVIVTARSFGSNSNKPYEVLKENGCEVIKL